MAKAVIQRSRRVGKSLLTEAHVQQTCVQLLELDGWRAFRTELTVQRDRGRVVGERGQPDYLFIRYLNSSNPGVQLPCAPKGRIYTPLAYVIWIEFKRPGEKPRADQLLWHAAERKCGALVMVVDDIDAFIAWYKASGLARRV